MTTPEAPLATSSSNLDAGTTETAHHPPPSANRHECKCQCNPECDCDCPCLVHCVCARKPDQGCECDPQKCDPKCKSEQCTPECKHVCKNKCGTANKKCRNLVVCLDGTSNQFGHWNTNIIELHNRISKESKDPNQLTFYSCGIGAYVPPTACRLVTWYRNTVDMAIARNFREIVEKAYQWLANHYRDGDRIFLFGFSRGAYQVRALAGMIQQVGLVFSGNTGLIPFAYEIYAKKHRGEDIRDEADARALAENFKRTFSREVKVHFVGVWDTVASVGIPQKHPLPLTTAAYHICTFRHGLALDELRVKFLPTYLAGGWTPNLQLDEYFNPDDKLMNVKEVWFVGSHSDVGGGRHAPRSLGLVSLLWMENQAIDAGLRFGPRTFVGEWMWDYLHKSKPTTSLHSYWRLAEILPFKRYRYTDPNSTTKVPHLGKGRSIVPRQRIHVSAAFGREKYQSKATFFGDKATNMESIINIHIKSDEFGDLSWADEWKHALEMDLFDDAFAQGMFKRLKSLTSREPGRTQNDSKIVGIIEGERLLWRLSIMALSYRSAKQISSEIGSLVKMLDKVQDNRIQAASAFCLFQLAKQGFSGQIASEENALRELERMLKGDVQIASLQCLSQLVLDSELESCKGKTQQDTDLGKATKILGDNQTVWPDFLYRYLVESGSDPSIQRVGLSCLMRLAKSEMKKTFIKWVDFHDEQEKTHAHRTELVSKLLEYLKQSQTRFHAALTLRNMSKEVIENWKDTQKHALFDSLMSGIRTGNPTAKGTYMRCLSKYIDEDVEFRQIALQTTNFIATLIAQLFSTDNHCSTTDKPVVMQAFLIIVIHKLEPEDPNTSHSSPSRKPVLAFHRTVGGATTESGEIIRMILEAICVNFWLNENDGAVLLLGILSKSSSLPLTLDETEGSFKAEKFPKICLADDMKSIPELIISEMVQLTRPTRIHQNGRQIDLGQILYRVQAFLNVFLLYDDLRRFIYANHDAFSTIITAMMHRTSRVKAVEFLESLVKYADPAPTDTSKLFMSLTIDIAKLGRNIMKSDKGSVFAIFQKDSARSLNDEGARPLAKVRDALCVLVPLHEDFMRHILEPKNFEIIKKTIDIQDIVHTHRGDQIEAEIAMVKCLQKFVNHPDGRKLMNNDLIRPLLQVHQAFNEELGSSQWLKRRPEYGIKLKETLEKFMLNIDREHFETLHKDVQEMLEQFRPTQSQSDEQEKTK